MADRIEKSWESTKRKQQRRILDFYIQRERSAIKTIFGILFFWLSLFFGVKRDWNSILILIFAGMAGGWILQRICGSNFSIAHSQVGKELRIYGELKKVKKDVEEQAKQALYCSGDQAITEKYLILSSVLGQSRFLKKGEGLCLISTRELEQIAIVDCLHGESTEENGYTMRFLTWDKRSFQLTVWGTYKEVFQIKKRLEECRDLGVGPAREQKEGVAGNDILAEKRQILRRQQRGYKKQILTGEKGVILGYYKKKKWLCMMAYFGVLGVFVVIMGLVFWIEWDSFQFLFQSVYWDWRGIGLWIGVYLMPMVLLLVWFWWRERQILRQYGRLKYYEQQELDRQIAEGMEGNRGAVICGKRCFWFQDSRRLGLHDLVFYEDVLWIYLSVRKIPIFMQKEGVSTFWMEYGVEFYTVSGKRHRVVIGDGKKFLECFPNAIKGYGKEQKREYKRLSKQMRG